MNSDADSGSDNESTPSVVPDSTSDQEELGNEQGVCNRDTFDTNLPTTHSYLGRLNSISGYTLYDDYDEIPLLAIFTDSLVLPGFTLPLVLTHYEEQNTIKMYLAESKTLGLVFADILESNLMFNYGVTMEVYESYSQGNSYYLKAKGRQRFQVIKNQTSFTTSRIKKLIVRILPEPPHESPLAATQLQSLNRWKARVTNFESQKKNKRFRRYDSAQFTFPLWLYDQYEVYYYVNEITMAFQQAKIPVPSDPIQLSYWFLQNYQLEHGERLEVLKLDSALQRLKLELHYLKKKRVLCCKICQQEVANQTHVFPMSKEGIQSNYCNPGGYVYETLTLSNTRNIDCFGRSSTEFSWFPGYAWTIAKCKSCQSQLGWKFTSSKLVPNLFWGLAKKCIMVKIIEPNQDSL